MKVLFDLFPVIAGILWGSVGIFVRIMGDAGMDNPTILLVRLLFASAIMFVGMLIYDKNLLRVKLKDLWVLAASGIFGMTLLNYCYNEAIKELTLSLAAVLLSMAPIVVIILAAFIFKEKLTVRKCVCGLVAIVGCVLVSGIADSGGEISWSLPGIGVGALSAVFYALGSVFSRIAADRGYNAVTITFYSIFIGLPLVLPFADYGTIGTYIEAAPISHILFMCVHAICAVVLPYILFTYGLKHSGTGKSSVLASGSEPSAAMIFGALFFGEIPTVTIVAGLVITILAITFLSLSKNENDSLS